MINMPGGSIWNDVAVVTMSDFARTLTSNGKGTDHAWGGNHMLLGGKVRGKQIKGKYPEDLAEGTSPWILTRGKVIPTTLWESI